MKILYTSPSIDPTKEKRHFLQLALKLKELGNNLLLLVPRYGKNKIENFDLKTVFIPVSREHTFLSYLGVEFLRFFYLPFLILKFQPDVIYNRKERFDFAPPFWSCLFRIPYVVEVNGILEQELKSADYPQWLIKTFKLIEIFNYKIASQVICIADGIKNWLVKHFRINENKLTVVSNGADTDFLRPKTKSSCRQELNLSENYFYLGFVGSFVQWQDLETLITAAQQVKLTEYPIRYILVGQGTDEVKLRQLTKQLGLEDNIFFAGWVDYEMVPLYIGAFDACYLSRMGYLSREEPNYSFSPLKLYEYLACARPIIAGRVPGITEVIREGNCGFLFSPGNSKELAKIIIACFQQQNTLASLGASGRKLVEKKYSWRIIAQRTIEILSMVCKLKKQ